MLGTLDEALDGGYCLWAINQTSTGHYDAARLGTTANKVVVTVDYNGAADAFVFNKSVILNESCPTISDNYWLDLNVYDLAPVDTTGLDNEAIVEMPNTYLGAETGGTWFVSGTVPNASLENTVDFQGLSWLTVWPTSTSPVLIDQDNWTNSSDYQIDSDADAPEGLAYSSDYLEVTANGEDAVGGHTYAVVVFLEFSVDSNGEVISTPPVEIQVSAGDGTWQANREIEFYYGTLTAADNDGWLGSFDFICESASGADCTTQDKYSSSEPFQLSLNGVTVEGLAGDLEEGNLLEYYNPGPVRWGDNNGCSFVKGSSPPEAACTGSVALNNGYAEGIYVYFVSWS